MMIVPMLATRTFEVIFPISRTTRKIADLFIKNMTLFFFFRFNSSISVCVKEKMDDSEREKKEDKIINRIKNIKKIVRFI